MPDRLCCNGFTFQHGMGCKRTQPATACFDNIKKKITKKFIPRGNKTNNALILHLDYLQKLLCMKELRFLRDDGDILTPEGEKKPHTTKNHHHTHKNPHHSYSVKEKTDSNSWTCSFLILAVIRRMRSGVLVWCRVKYWFFQTVLLSSHFAVPPPTLPKATSKHSLTGAKQF